MLLVRAAALVAAAMLATAPNEPVSPKLPGEAGSGGGQFGELVDRTLAIVGTQVITLGDVRAAVALGLVAGGDAPDRMTRATQDLVDRELILREVQRYAPPAPSESEIDVAIEATRKRFTDAAAFTAALTNTGFTAERLRAWLRDDLRSQTYLAQRFASASTPSDAEILEIYTRDRAAFERAGFTFEQASPAIRERLVATRRRELIADWVADLRRRTDVVILPQ